MPIQVPQLHMSWMTAADPRAQELAEDFGFTYIVRPDRGRHKKSGNIRYAFARHNW